MLTNDQIRALFLVLHAGGCRMPDAHKSPNGLDAGISVYALTLDGLTFDEVQEAARAYLSRPCPFWPTPGQLLELVPDIDGAKASHRKLLHGGTPNLIERALIERIGLGEGYPQAYRAAKRVMRDTPPDEMQARGPRGCALPRLSDTVLSRLPRLLTAHNQEPER